jgi:cell division protein FtsL
MTQAIAQNINDIMRFKERIFIFLVAGIFVSIFSYAYFLHSAIVNVVERENVVKESKSISTNVGSLEAKYFSIKNTINIKLASEKGFKNSDDVKYITAKKSITAMANINEL